eukprot:6207105-Pleurochrysis_carterae.AAC.4
MSIRVRCAQFRLDRLIEAQSISPFACRRERSITAVLIAEKGAWCGHLRPDVGAEALPLGKLCSLVVDVRNRISSQQLCKESVEPRVKNDLRNYQTQNMCERCTLVRNSFFIRAWATQGGLHRTTQRLSRVEVKGFGEL